MSKPFNLLGRALLLAALFTIAMPGFAARDADQQKDAFSNLKWRSLGPPNMGGRVTDVGGIPGDPRTVYVGTAAGGVWKTTDGGTTFEPIFDDQDIASIGDIALAPSNREIIYVGTGEDAARNSVSFGNGMYRSTDGGKTWTHIGLEQTQYISRIQVHPNNPDIVYAGALGPVFGPGEDRGVYRSVDGGQSWEKVLYIDEVHGVSDLVMHPTNPQVLYAGMWKFQRKPWTFTSGSEQTGVFKSVDGGDSWQRLEKGLPELMGRIGIAVAPSQPDMVYVIAESNEGTLFRSTDSGESFEKRSDDTRIVSRGFYYSKVRVDPRDANRVYGVASLLMRSMDGGKTFERISGSTHIDFHALWIDPENPDRVWQGQDGGIAVSYDRGESWDPIRNVTLAQFYQVFYDYQKPFYKTGGGLQDNGTWIGPSRTRERAGIYPHDWKMMSFGDAYWVVPHPEREALYLSEAQGGNIWRTDLETGQQVGVSPQPERNDGGPVSELKYRFDWNAPIVRSPHDNDTVYFAANVVFRTDDFGDTWTRISPDLTKDNPEHQGPAGGPVWPENTVAEYHNTIIAVAESPVEPGLLWAGSDDGSLHISDNGGDDWQAVYERIGVDANGAVRHVEPSRTDADTAYVAIDRHMFDDRTPYIYRTENRGRSWTRITDGLPEQAFVWVVREDLRNPDMLYAGTELGLFFSRDRGESWQELDLANLPTTPVRDLVIHPEANDIIVGTHGRGLYVFDDATPVQRFDQTIADKTAHLFGVRAGMRHAQTFQRYGTGDRMYIAPNPPYGALISYYLSEEVAETLGDGNDNKAGNNGEDKDKPTFKLELLNGDGAIVRTIEADDLKAEPGINRVAWDLATDPPKLRTDEFKPEGAFDRPPSGVQVMPGQYTARLSVGDTVQEQPVAVTLDPTLDVTSEALQAQHDAASRLLPMESAINQALRGIDAVRAQLEQRQQTAAKMELQLPQAIKDAIETHKDRMKEIEGRLTRMEGKPRWAQGPGLLEKIASLRGAIDSGFRAPSQPQRELLESLTERFDQAIAEVNAYFREDLAELNARLEEAEMPRVAAPPAI